MGEMCRTENCRQLQFASYCFDASIAEIFTTLCNGAALVVAPRSELIDPDALGNLLRRHGVNLLTLPPSYLPLLNADDFPELHQLIVAGESCPAQLVNAWSPGRKFYNAYGPTETTVCATLHLCSGDYSQSPPIGKPIENASVYVLDEGMNPSPLGVTGELYIGGAGVALGYLNRETLTQEKFLPSPFEAGARLYRTGDLGRWRADGQLEFIGRNDAQIKVRGFRVELGEIEASLLGIEGISQAAVLAHKSQDETVELVAYIATGGHQIPQSELREKLGARLPNYMMPRQIMQMDSLPLSPNGKVDRSAISKLQIQKNENQDLPKNDSERKILAIWCDVLGVENIGTHENFLDSGGHSLLAVRVMRRVQEDFALEAPLRWIFETPTISGLAARVDASLRSDFAGVEEDGSLPQNLPDVLVPLGRISSAPAVFVFSPAGGTVYPYYPIAHALGDAQPVWALQDPAMKGLRKPMKTVEEMAAHYIGAIKFVQPKGPYHICGWSLGAVVGFEVAQQLAANGDKVGLLALIEPGKAIALDKGTLLGWMRNRRDSVAMRFSVFVSSLEASKDALYLMFAPKKDARKKGLSALRDIGATVFWRMLLSRAHIGEVVAEDDQLLLIKQPGALQFLPIARANVKAARKYWPKPYPGHVVLFRGSTTPEEGDPVVADWVQLAHTLEVHTIAGDHFSLTRNPASTEIAKIMSAKIELINREQSKLA